MIQEAILRTLHPLFRHKVELWVQELEKRGIKIELTSGLRSKTQQDALYAIGRTKPGKIVTNARGTPVPQSLHVFGLACDFIPVLKGSRIYDMPTIKRAGQIAKECGLEWGGDWKSFPDFVHVQYTQGKPLSHFQAGGTIDDPEPTFTPTPEARIIALTKRKTRTALESVRDMIDRVIDRLKRRA